MTEYKFKKYDISSNSTDSKNKIYDYGVDYNFLKNGEESLFKINSHLWTSEKIQKLINDCLELEPEKALEYQVEDGRLGIIIYTDEVYFFNLSNEKEVEDFKWSFDKFISFLNDFKSFLIQNRK